VPPVTTVTGFEHDVDHGIVGDGDTDTISGSTPIKYDAKAGRRCLHLETNAENYSRKVSRGACRPHRPTERRVMSTIGATPRFVLTRQCLLDALLENLEKALGRRPVKIGEEGKEVYVYRGDVANNALKMAGSELGLFTDKSGVTHRPSHYDDLSDADLVRKLRDEALLLLEHHEREAGEADGNAEVPGSC